MIPVFEGWGMSYEAAWTVSTNRPIGGRGTRERDLGFTPEEHADRPAPAELIARPATRSAGCSPSTSSTPAGPEPAREPGRTGDDATNTAPAPACGCPKLGAPRATC